MKRSILIALTTAAFLTLPGYLFSQTKLKVSGSVADSSKPLSLVTVRIFKKNATNPLQTVLSKEDGSYQLNKPAAGNYTLSFTYTGFAAKQIDIDINAAESDQAIDAVQMSRATGNLKEVVV